MNEVYNLTGYTLVCFSHLRWNFVYQRPQHLMSRCSKLCRVFYIEEPIFSNESDRYQLNVQDNVGIVTPILNDEANEKNTAVRINDLLKDLFQYQSINKYLFWYYTPMALSFTESFDPELIIYDCMDELSAFRFVPAELKELEKEMFRRADLVLTGGQNLYEHKKDWHHNIYPLPSSIDREHFARARSFDTDPADQREVRHPRFGYYGVIDERFDVDLIDTVAAEKPDWYFIFIGPVVKIDPSSLPNHSNICYLGSKKYEELPGYLAGWDIALIPFVRNQYTEFISPTKTPEYLAAGKPVISTSIKDVVSPYGINGLVKIADSPDEFIHAADSILSEGTGEHWLRDVDNFLSVNSWDKTWTRVLELMKMAMHEENKLSTLKKRHYV
jgi:glycosyltransferase involved in cell wall biosynthesis